MCKLILSHQRTGDVLLFSTILSTDLNILKRRGFAVNRCARAFESRNRTEMSRSVLNARKAEQAVREQEERDARIQRDLQATSEISPDQVQHAMKQLLDIFPDADPVFLEAALKKQDSNHLNKVVEQMMHSPYPKRRTAIQAAAAEEAPRDPPESNSERQSGLFSNFRRRLAGQPVKAPPIAPPAASPGIEKAAEETKGMPTNTGGRMISKPATQATPFSDIKSVFTKASRYALKFA